MANSTHTVICPYFKNEHNLSLTCEDVCRGFCSINQKNSWMYMYCDTWDWMKCPYAADLTEAYDRQEKGDDTALEKNKIKSLEKENRGLQTNLGRATKKIERLHQVNEMLHKKWMKTNEELENYKKNESVRYFKMAKLYEDRLAFLIDTYCQDSRLPESDVKAWAKGKEYALTFDEKATEPIWIVKTREELDGQQDKDIQTDVQEEEVRKPEGAD